MVDQKFIILSSSVHPKVRAVGPGAFAVVSTGGDDWLAQMAEVRQAAGRKNNCRIFITIR
jgi:hypothetical protein